MAVATVSSKCQITLPAEVRRVLGIGPKDRVRIWAEQDRIIVERVQDLMELGGFLGKARARVDERDIMMRHVADQVLGKNKGGNR